MSDPQNQIEQAASMVKSIPVFITSVSEVIQSPYGWIVLVGLLIWFFINRDLTNVFGIFERREKLKIEKIELYVNNKDLADEKSLKVIKDLRDSYYFKVATGIYAEKGRRESLIKLHDLTSHAIDWVQVKRALPYIEIKSCLTPFIRDFNTMEKVGRVYNNFMGAIFLFFAVLLLLMLFVSKPQDVSGVLIGIGGVLASGLFSMVLFAQNWPYESAKRIKSELQKNSESSEAEKN